METYTPDSLRNLFQSSFNLAQWYGFLQHFFNASELKEKPERIIENTSDKGYYLGNIDTTDSYRIGLFQYNITKGSVANKRVGLRNLVKSFINPGFFTGGNTNMIDDVVGAENFEPPKRRKRGRPVGSKNKKPENSENITVLNDGSALVLADDGSTKSNMVQTNTPYLESFKETNNLLKQELNRLDMLQNNIMIDLEYVRGSKTIKKKFDYVSMLGSTLGAISSNKVTVIKEMNKTILDCHNLDLKRAKDLKLNETKDDNKTIMDMYTAFVNTPVGTYVPGAPPPISNLDLTMRAGTEGLVRTEIPSDTPQQQNGITSAQNHR